LYVREAEETKALKRWNNLHVSYIIICIIKFSDHFKHSS
jgi:hypothetical protein